MWLMNRRTGGAVASHVELACTRATRRQGLLQRDGLDPSAAMILAPCFLIHTGFMRFSIDVLFIDGESAVCRVVPNLPPWRMAGDLRGRTVIELAGGTAAERDVRVGDQLYLSAAVSGGERSLSAVVGPGLRKLASSPARSGA